MTSQWRRGRIQGATGPWPHLWHRNRGQHTLHPPFIRVLSQRLPFYSRLFLLFFIDAKARHLYFCPKMTMAVLNHPPNRNYWRERHRLLVLIAICKGAVMLGPPPPPYQQGRYFLFLFFSKFIFWHFYKIRWPKAGEKIEFEERLDSVTPS